MFWALAGSAFSLLVVGIAMGFYNDNFVTLPIRHPWLVDMFTNSWTAPLVMCLFLDPEMEAEGRDWQRILDFAQVGIVFLLLYLYSSNFAVPGPGFQPWRLAMVTDGLITAGFFLRGASTPCEPARTLFRRFGYFRLVAVATDFVFVLGLPEPQVGEWFDIIWSLTTLIALMIVVDWRDGGQPVGAMRTPSTYQRLLLTQLMPLIFPVLVLITASQVAAKQLVLAATAVLCSVGIGYARLLITQREQQGSEEALRRSHNLLQSIMEGANEAIFVKDLQGRYLIINAPGAQSIGRSVPEVIGRDDRDLFTPDIAHRVRQADQQVMQSGKAQTYEYAITVAGGAERTFLATKSPYREPQGNIIGLIGISLDITERRKLEEQLRQTQKMEAIGTLSGGIAHDFNNLLTVIKGYSRMILDCEQDKELRTEVEHIDQAAERAASLTRQLLAFSRRQVLQPKVFNLNALMLNLDRMLRRLIGEDINMVTIAAPDLDSVKADPGQIEQVIMNLVVNARDAMPRGGKLTLETANADFDEEDVLEHLGMSPGQYVVLAVSDTGVGMDSETRTHIFEPFFTTKEQGRGTGLGLSMVYGIVKQSGGDIWVYSEPGKGSTFKIYLPQVDAVAEDIAAKQRPGGKMRGNETILLLEDDLHVRELARAVLTTCGYSVLVGEDALTVISLCEHYAGPVHLLLTDVVMPGLSGREVASQVLARWPETKVLYMSGHATNAIAHHGVLDGTFFLPKPFTPGSLAAKVREVLDQTPTTREPP